MKTALLFIALFIVSCSAQPEASSNEIFSIEERLMGVKSSNGEVLIAPTHLHIAPIPVGEKLILPPLKADYQRESIPTEYYRVINEKREQAVFDAEGKLIFDFCECERFQIDQHTHTIAVTYNKKRDGNKTMLYSLDGEVIFGETFENIGYINDSDLIALIKEDGSNDEFYLYNPFTKTRIGPYDHFNIYNKDFDPTLGIKTIKFDKLNEPLGISVRNNNTWGFIDMKGNEIHPMKYGKFSYLSNEQRRAYIESSKKPEGVDFIFFARLKEDRSKMSLFDRSLKEYSLTRSESRKYVIKLMKYGY